jgi:hypothetical protein
MSLNHLFQYEQTLKLLDQFNGNHETTDRGEESFNCHLDSRLESLFHQEKFEFSSRSSVKNSEHTLRSVMTTPKKPYSRSPFSPEEDAQLRHLVSEHGLSAWVEIANLLPGRNPRQCRERWKHYLSSDQGSLPWTEAEDALLFEKVAELGPKWTRLAKVLGNRTDIEVKMRWLKKFNHIIRLLPRSGRTPLPSHPTPCIAQLRRLPPVQKPKQPTAQVVSRVEPLNLCRLMDESAEFFAKLEAVLGPFP